MVYVRVLYFYINVIIYIFGDQNPISSGRLNCSLLRPSADMNWIAQLTFALCQRLPYAKIVTKPAAALTFSIYYFISEVL